jgi:tRNA nucleotidyltransferase/poly(A) polymerase
VWLVGGAVRDAVLGRSIRDWDFAVEHSALGLARAVADELGGAFFALDAARDTGRALVADPAGMAVDLDFAGLRGSDLQADLVMRDFTINALAIDEDGRMHDPTGGMDDVRSSTVRMASASAFDDDPLRLLRAVRIAGELAFAIESATLAAIERSAHLLSTVSAERQRDELMRLLDLPAAGAALRHAANLGLLAAVVSEVAQLASVPQSPPHRFEALTHSLVAVDTVENVIETVLGLPRSTGMADSPPEAWDGLAASMVPFADYLASQLSTCEAGGYRRTTLLKLAGLVHDVGKASTAEHDASGAIHFYDHGPAGASIVSARLNTLRFSRDAVKHVSAIVRHHLRPAELARAPQLTRRAIFRYFRDLGSAGVDTVILSLADHLATWGPALQGDRWRRRLQVASALVDSYLHHFDERIEPPPIVSGQDLMDCLQLKPGPSLGQILDQIREAQAAGEIVTREQALDLARRSAAAS